MAGIVCGICLPRVVPLKEGALKYAKPDPLIRKQRFNPQIFAAFGSGWIKICADCIDPKIFSAEGILPGKELIAPQKPVQIVADLSRSSINFKIMAGS